MAKIYADALQSFLQYSTPYLACPKLQQERDFSIEAAVKGILFSFRQQVKTYLEEVLKFFLMLAF